MGKDAAALCYPRGTLCLQADGAYYVRLTGLTDWITAFSPSFAAQTVVFLYLFQLKKGDGSHDDAKAGSEQHLVQGSRGPGY